MPDFGIAVDNRWLIGVVIRDLETEVIGAPFPIGVLCDLDGHLEVLEILLSFFGFFEFNSHFFWEVKAGHVLLESVGH